MFCQDGFEGLAEVIDRPLVCAEEAESPRGRAQSDPQRLTAVESPLRVERLVEVWEVLRRSVANDAKDGRGYAGAVCGCKDFVAFHVNYIGARLR